MSFVRTIKGHFVSLRTIREVSVGNVVTLRLDSGADCYAKPEEWLQAVASHGSTTFQALPRTYRLEAYLYDHDLMVESEPVIGWQVHQSGKVSPICVSGAKELSDHMAVLHPDNAIQNSEGNFLDVDDWFYHMSLAIMGYDVSARENEGEVTS